MRIVQSADGHARTGFDVKQPMPRPAGLGNSSTRSLKHAAECVVSFKARRTELSTVTMTCKR